jgi:drug/metabolite transporter (DMT)-like permease
MKSQRKGLLLLAFAVVYLVWGSTYLGIRFAIETLPPLMMAGTRFTVAGAALLAWTIFRGYERPKLVQWRTAAILGVLMLLFGNGGVTLAERNLSSGLAALLVATEPIWIVLLNWLRPGGRAPRRLQIAGLVTGFAGVALLVTGSGGATGSLGSALLVLGAAFGWAVGSIYATGAPAAPAPVQNGMIMLAGGIVMLLSGLLHGEAAQVHFSRISAVSAGALVYLTVMGSLAAFSAYTYLLSTTTPAMASTYAFVNPVVAVLLGAVVGGEHIAMRTLAAMCIIVLAVVLLVVPRKRPAADQSTYREADVPEPAASC